MPVEQSPSRLDLPGSWVPARGFLIIDRALIAALMMTANDTTTLSNYVLHNVSERQVLIFGW